jgi:hypothetical protein
MNLHERLEAAKAERRVRAGLPPEEPEVSPMHQPRRDDGDEADREAAIDLTGYAPIVDLRPEILRRDSEPSFTGALAVGEGSTCPNCGCEGRLDMEDVVGGVDHLSCTNCGLLFQVAR